MTSEVKPRPRLFTGGFRSQWVNKKSRNVGCSYNAKWGKKEDDLIKLVQIPECWSSDIIRFMDLDSVFVYRHAKKELCKYLAILTSHMVNNLCVNGLSGAQFRVKSGE